MPTLQQVSGYVRSCHPGQNGFVYVEERGKSG